MAETQANAVSLLRAWFDKADKWQKDLFCQIWQGNEDVETEEPIPFPVKPFDLEEVQNRLAKKTFQHFLSECQFPYHAKLFLWRMPE